jgi:hypothetical protein
LFIKYADIQFDANEDDFENEIDDLLVSEVEDNSLTELDYADRKQFFLFMLLTHILFVPEHVYFFLKECLLTCY